MDTSYYVSQEHVTAELTSRAFLKCAVEDFWSTLNIPFPKIMNTHPMAVIGRQIPTFRFEDAVFILMAESLGLQPIWLSYKEDIFVAGSKGKRSLIRPKLTSRVNKHGKLISVTTVLADIECCQRKELSSIQVEDTTLSKWHHARLVRAYPSAIVKDLSGVCKILGGRAELYYRAYLSLFVTHGVLFEDYHNGESGTELDQFTRRVFEPAAEWIQQQFGVMPLLVALPWDEEFEFYPNGELFLNWRLHAQNLYCNL